MANLVAAYLPLVLNGDIVFVLIEFVEPEKTGMLFKGKMSVRLH